MNRVVHFEIPSSNVEKSQQFFENVFGWKSEKWGDMPYWMMATGDQKAAGINGALMPKDEIVQSIVNTISVEDSAKAREAIEANGGEVISETQTVPTIGYFFYFKDPDGNIHGAMQEDSNAQ